MFWINQAREYLPAMIGGISWIGLDRPAANCLIPFYAGVTNLPAKIQTMNLMKFDRENSAWWAFNFVGNYATIKYCYMIEDIKAKQQEIERKSFNALPDLDKKASDLYEAGDIEDCRKLLTDFCNNRTCEIVADWWKLSESLIVKYNDGCITDEKDIMQHVSYPCDWLLNSGYFQGPVSYKKPE